jgi:hypothetical protein
MEGDQGRHRVRPQDLPGTPADRRRRPAQPAGRRPLAKSEQQEQHERRLEGQREIDAQNPQSPEQEPDADRLGGREQERGDGEGQRIARRIVHHRAAKEAQGREVSPQDEEPHGAQRHQDAHQVDQEHGRDC